VTSAVRMLWTAGAEPGAMPVMQRHDSEQMAADIPYPRIFDLCNRNPRDLPYVAGRCVYFVLCRADSCL
jgi:hypothetical protein